jgi:hypothetical protein
MRKSKRQITRAKMYGFNPFADQVDYINRLVAESGQTEATVLRKLIDEALIARRRKAADDELAEAVTKERTIADRLEAIEQLLTLLVQQGGTLYHMHDISLALLQDTLAESRAGRNVIWRQMAPAFKEQGLTRNEIAKRFDEETDEAKDFAYGAAQDLKKQQEQ